MSVKDGLLALLANGEQHGYGLKTEFEAAIGDLWQLNIGQVYTSLQRLERDGFVEVADDDGERKTYRLTLAGRDAADAWLVSSEKRATDIRDDVATKVLVALRSERGDPLAVIDAQREATMQALQRLTRDRTRAEHSLAQQIQLDRLALRWRAELDWLDLIEDRLRSPNGTTTSTTAPQSTGNHR